MKDNIAERINEIMQFFKIKKSDFSKKIGLDNYSTITRIAAGEYKPSYEVLNRIINSFPDINSTWLLTGKLHVFQGLHGMKKIFRGVAQLGSVLVWGKRIQNQHM